MSGHPDPVDEAVDLGTQALSLTRQILGRGQGLTGHRARGPGGLGNIADMHRNLLGAGRGLLDVTGDFVGSRALLLNERAARAEEAGDTRGALITAAKAFAADPTVTAAAVRLAHLYAADGRRRKAVTVLEKAWRAAPAPELVRACADLPPVEDAVQRLRRVERLVAVGHAETPLGHLCVAEAALDAKLWGVARQHLLAARELQPGAGTYRLLARLEQSEYHDQAAAQAWLAKAETAPAEAGWTCGACAARPGAWFLVCPACGSVDSLAWS